MISSRTRASHMMPTQRPATVVGAAWEQVAWAIVTARARVVLRALQLRTMQAARVRWLRRTAR